LLRASTRVPAELAERLSDHEWPTSPAGGGWAPGPTDGGRVRCGVSAALRKAAACHAARSLPARAPVRD